jgi:hypothetical protein
MFEKQIALCLFGHIMAAEATEGIPGNLIFS